MLSVSGNVYRKTPLVSLSGYMLISLTTRHYSGCTLFYMSAHHCPLTAILNKPFHKMNQNNTYGLHYFLLASRNTLRSCIRGSRDGAVVRALASHQCGLASIPGLGVICGLSLLLALVLAPRDFSLSTPVFLPLSKTTILNSNSIWNSRATGLSITYDCQVSPSLNKVDLFIYLFNTTQGLKLGFYGIFDNFCRGSPCPFRS